MITMSFIFKSLAFTFQMMLGVFGGNGTVHLQESVPPAGYVCRQPVWVRSPELKSGVVYLAAMSTECTVYPQLGGDLEKLQAFSIEQIRSQAQVDRGPIDATFEGMPSKYLDVLAIIKGRDSVSIQQDVNVATDKVTRLVSSTVSRKISGTGNGAYLKKLDSRIDVTKTSVKTEDRVVISFSTEVEKPWYAPEGMFLAEIEKRVPGEFAKLRDKVVEEMGKNY